MTDPRFLGAADAEPDSWASGRWSGAVFFLSGNNIEQFWGVMRVRNARNEPALRTGRPSWVRNGEELNSLRGRGKPREISSSYPHMSTHPFKTKVCGRTTYTMAGRK